MGEDESYRAHPSLDHEETKSDSDGWQEVARKQIASPRASSSSLGDNEGGYEHSSLLNQLNQRRSNDRGPLRPTPSPGSDQWTQETKSSWYLILLTLGGLGLQIGWSVESSYGSPFLLSLDLSKSALALVWIAGPLSGVLMQPLVGVKSDHCRSRWGRRRPFIVGGCVATVVALMMLAWSRELVVGPLSIFGADKESEGVKRCVQAFAVVLVFVVDFALNMLQAALRMFIVDCAPAPQQDAANAWMSRTQSLGGIIACLFGAANLSDTIPFLGDSQFKILCAIASFILLLTNGISTVAIQERGPVCGAQSNTDGVLAVFKSLYGSVRRLPRQISIVCRVQFAAWLCWSPFLLYITTYVGEIYAEPFFEADPHMETAEVDRLWEKATRVGTFALLVFAMMTFVSSVFLPYFVAPSHRQTPKSMEPMELMEPLASTAPATQTAWAPMTSGRAGFLDSKLTNRTWSRFAARLDGLLSTIRNRSLSLRRLWLLSHLCFAICMAATFFTRSVTAATILVGIVGIPWSVALWVPFALISAELSKQDALRDNGRSSIRNGLAANDGDPGPDEAGVILGIHNVACSMPQFVSTLISTVIFSALQKPRGSSGDNSIAWTLRIAGLCALGAAWFARDIAEETHEK